jgi:hypothetical protein
LADSQPDEVRMKMIEIESVANHHNTLYYLVL